MNSPIRKSFNGWKIFVAIAIGLLVSSWMLYNSLSQAQFVESVPGEGEYVWVDSNEDGMVDTHDPEEFTRSPNGNYRQHTFNDAFAAIDWTHSSIFWLIGAVFMMVGRDYFYMLRLRFITKKKLSWKATAYVILIWEFASALSPGVVGGAAVAMFILNRESIPFGRSTAIVIITAFMDNLFFIVMIPIVFLFVSHSTLFPPEEGYSLALGWWFWMGFFIILFICLLLYLTLFWYPRLTTKLLLFIFRLRFLKRWKFVAAEWGKDIEQASKEFRREPGSFWLKIFFATFMSWISRYLVINALMNAFIPLGFFENMQILGKQLILWLFMLVSPTPGGSGVAEFAFGELLSSFSTSAILITALAILWRLVSYFPYLFIGAVLLPAWLRRTKK